MNEVATQMIANIIKALSSPARIKIINMLKNESLCVCKIIEGLGMEQSNTSQHLNVLKNAGIVEARKDGLNVIYSLKYTQVFHMLELSEEILKLQLEDAKKSLNHNEE